MHELQIFSPPPLSPIIAILPAEARAYACVLAGWGDGGRRPVCQWAHASGSVPPRNVVAVSGQHISATEEEEDEGLPREQEAAFVADYVSLSADMSC